MEDEEDFKIFISHGQSQLWKSVARFIENELEFGTVELSEAPNRGRTIIQKLDEETEDCHFAVIILTAEDEMASGNMRARQNVIHEIGFFQGKFGLENVLFLKENKVEGFSNFDGIVYEVFSPNSIQSTYERIRKEIKLAYEEWANDDEDDE